MVKNWKTEEVYHEKVHNLNRCEFKMRTVFINETIDSQLDKQKKLPFTSIVKLLDVYVSIEEVKARHKNKVKN